MYVKIKNLIKKNGNADYKGLDIVNVLGGTQIYPQDRNVAFIGFDGDLVEHEDIEVITEEQYQLEVQAQKDYADSFITPEKELAALKQSQADQDEAIMLLTLGGM